MVLVAPETRGFDQVLMVLDPNAVGSAPGMTLNLPLNAYDKDGGLPSRRPWIADGLARDVDQ